MKVKQLALYYCLINEYFMVSEPWLSVSNHILIVTKFNYFSAKNMGVGREYFIGVSFVIFNILLM